MGRRGGGASPDLRTPVGGRRGCEHPGPRGRPENPAPRPMGHRGRTQRDALMTGLDIGVYVPQMALSYDDVLHRAVRCEELGIGSVWLYDHLYGPGAPDIPSLEAWTLATALLARTERLRVGHMVLCNQFRHPAVVAKMGTPLDQVSAARLQLGIGTG